jgi:Ca-activated chloride channel family protein
MKAFVIQWPPALWLLPLLVPLGVLLARARSKRAALSEQIGGGSGVRGRRRDWLRVAALGCLVLALARPGYAPERRAISQGGRDVVFALDVSQSMLAEDAQPSRLGAAKQGVRDALEWFGSERAGLVIYAGSATIQCPLTFDHEFVRYMLEQSTTRTVDFGGTTLLSAVEKAVDNVFTDERRGMQDLVVLTDGEDHGPEMSRVASMLSEHGVDLLVVGLGDADVGSRIPVEDGQGARRYLKHEGEFVSTRLNEEALRELAGGIEGAEYVGAGTAAFDLGDIYANYAAGKAVAGAVGSETFVVYREAGFLLIAVALVLFAIGGRTRKIGPVVAGVLLACVFPLDARESWLEVSFAKARDLQVAGRFDEALEAYGELDAGGGVPVQIAALRFNQGLCQLARAEALAEESPEGALSAARAAQWCFLDAKRLDDGMDRAGRRLDSTAATIARYAKAAEEREKQEQEIQKQLNDLIERLKVLLENQSALHAEVRAKDPKARPVARRKPGQPAPPPPAAPATAAEDARGFVERQVGLTLEGRSIRGAMEALDRVMHPPAPAGQPAMESLLKEPLRLMGEAVDAQQQADGRVASWTTWELARAHQLVAIQRIREILDLLEGGDPNESDEGDWEDYEEEWDMDDYEDGEEGMPSSTPMQGDLAAGGEMQPLPVPNYSVEDLLMEEQGNLQFRQQQRAKAQAGKVKKDW